MEISYDGNGVATQTCRATTLYTLTVTKSGFGTVSSNPSRNELRGHLHVGLCLRVGHPDRKPGTANVLHRLVWSLLGVELDVHRLDDRGQGGACDFRLPSADNRHGRQH